MLSWKESLKAWCETHGMPDGGYGELSIKERVKYVPFNHAIALGFAEIVALMDNPGYAASAPFVVLPQDGSIKSRLKQG